MARPGELQIHRQEQEPLQARGVALSCDTARQIGRRVKLSTGVLRHCCVGEQKGTTLAGTDASDALNSVIALMALTEFSSLQTLETLGVIDQEQLVGLLRSRADLYQDAPLPAPVVGLALANQLREYADAVEQGQQPVLTLIKGGKDD
jgi:hypothetical protein